MVNMKRTKKLLSMALTLVMTLALAAPALAAVDITVDDGGYNGSYVGYQLFTATADSTDVNWAYAYNDKYKDIVITAAQTAGNKSDMTTSLQNNPTLMWTLLGELTADQLRTFADTVYKAIKTAGLEPDATATNGVFTGVGQGYWLIADTTNNAGANAANSLVLLDSAGNNNVTVTPKTSVPTLAKKVLQDTGLQILQDAADYDIGDTVTFTLEAVVPENISNYESYTMVFHDTLPAGLTYDGTKNIVAAVQHLDVDGNRDTTHPSGAELIAQGLTTNTAPTDGCSVEFTVDLKALKRNNSGTMVDIRVDAYDKIQIQYSATLNENAVVGAAGNDNSATLEYSNDPYDSTSTGRTTEATATVFTYELVVNKVGPNRGADAADNPTVALPGAGFTLYKLTGGAVDADPVWTSVKVIAADAAISSFSFKGLDAGTYKLEESTVPAGYNKAADVMFTIAATYDTTGVDPQLTALTATDVTPGATDDEKAQFAVSLTPGEGAPNIGTTVLNQSGVELPSTGGVGTVIFTVVGLAIVIGVAVAFIVKKRASDSNE